VNLLLAFAPFIVFVVLERLLGIPAGLAGGAVIAAALLVRDLLAPGRRPKLLGIAIFLLFGGLSLLVPSIGGEWSAADVRLRVDAGLLLIVLLSMVLGRPFSMQYAREDMDQRAEAQHWDSPEFLRIHYVVSAAWAAAFGVLVLGDAVMAFMPEALPQAGSVLVPALALAAAAWFAGWYPEQRRPLKQT
jgi:hypothetical protein